MKALFLIFALFFPIAAHAQAQPSPDMMRQFMQRQSSKESGQLASDPGGDDVITRTEFLLRAEKLFNSMDKDGDGKLTPAERQESHGTVRNRLQQYRNSAPQ